MQVVLGLPEPRQFSSLPRLKLVQSGIQRTQLERSPGNTRIRLSITSDILIKIRSHWSQVDPSPTYVMLWAAAVLCFFGFFRSGEITLPSTKAFDQSQHLAWGDIAIDDRSNPSMLKVHLKKSKMDQAGRGVDVFVGRTNGPLCPLVAVLSYITVRGATAGPFFQFPDGQPLIKSRFIDEVRIALQAVGLPYQCFAGHSFRIGAVTAAAKAGLEDSVIRMLGRWNSNAFSVIHPHLKRTFITICQPHC